MSKLLCVIWICLATVSAQPTGKYQVGTITNVKPHQVAPDATSDVVSYDVSLKVKGHNLPVAVHTAARHEHGSVRSGV